MLRKIYNRLFEPKSHKQRRKVYKWLLKYFKKKRFVSGFCIALDCLPSEYGGYVFNSIYKYPELVAQKPTHGLSYWWPRGEREPRIKAIETAIKMLDNATEYS